MDMDYENMGDSPSDIVSQPLSAKVNVKKRGLPRSTNVSQPSSKLSRRNSPSPAGRRNVYITKRVNPYKSQYDPNEYRIITLSTGLTVFLISREEMELGSSSSSSSKRGGFETQMSDLGILPSLTYLPAHENMLPCHQLTEQPICSFIDEIGFQGSPSIVPSFLPINCEDDLDTSRTFRSPTSKSKKSATSVAVVVNVGGFQDPHKAQGLAHFTEHMVHYGSKKFPGENEIKLLVSNFGTGNAFTTQQVTAYFNQVPNSILGKNLELYTEMLTNPLFLEENLKREVQAVDSEFYLKKRYWTRQILLQHVVFSKTKHPLGKFTCGNKETLTKCEGSDGKKMREVMTDSHARYYVTSAMTACINSEKSLDELEDLAIIHFANFKEGPSRLLHQSETKISAGDKLSKADLKHLKGKYIYLQGDSRRAELALNWIIPPTLSADSQETPEFVGKLLRNSSENGLRHSLYNEGLIYGMGTKVSNLHYCTLVEMVIHLTPKGREMPEHIIQETFAYIKSLQDTSEADFQRFFDEIKLYYQREFHFGSQFPNLNTTMGMAMLLQEKDDFDRIILDSVWDDAQLQNKLVERTLKQLNDPDHLIVIETIPRHELLSDMPIHGKIEIAPYTEARYMIVDKKINYRQSCSRCRNYGIPSSNPFLKHDYSKIQRMNGSGDADQLFPTSPKVCDGIGAQRLSWKSKVDPNGKTDIPKITGVHFGHDPDNDDDKYKGIVKMHFASPMSQESDRNRALAYLWAFVIRDKLSCKMAAMTMGSYEVHVVPGMTILIKGFPEHMEHVIKAILMEMFDVEISELEFSTAKEHIKVKWEESVMSGESGTISMHILESVVHGGYSSMDLLGQLDDIELSDLKSAIRAFRMSSRCYVILGGNLPVESFKTIAKILDDKDFGPHLDSSAIATPLRYDHVMPSMYLPGEKVIRVISTKSVGVTTSVTNMYSLGQYQKDSLESDLFNLAMRFIHCQAFSFLRTKEQLGYAVQAKHYSNRRMRAPLMMFSVHVVATARKHTACELNEKIEEFLDEFGNDLIHMDDVIFNKMKEMRGFPTNITKQLVGEWFKSKFEKDNSDFPKHLKYTLRGVKKVSIQVLTGNPHAQCKPCKCENCNSIKWEEGSAYESTLKFAVQDGNAGENGHFMKPDYI